MQTIIHTAFIQAQAAGDYDTANKLHAQLEDDNVKWEGRAPNTTEEEANRIQEEVNRTEKLEARIAELEAEKSLAAETDPAHSDNPNAHPGSPNLPGSTQVPAERASLTGYTTPGNNPEQTGV